MGVISLKLSDDLLETSGRCAWALHLSLAEYVRLALKQMNRETRLRLRAHRLAEASGKVRKQSMRVNAEFEVIERAPEA